MACALQPKQIANGSTNQILVAGASVLAYQTLGGDATLAGGTLTIASGAVSNAKLANMAANTVKVRNANSSGVPSDVALATTQILIGDGTGFTAAALSADVTMTNAGVVTIANGAVTLAKMANLATDRLIGRDTAGSGAPEALTVAGGLEFTGAGGIQTGAFTGDVTKAAGGTALTIAAGAVDEAELNNVDGGVDAQSFVHPTGYASGAGTVVAGDTVDAAIRKLDGNIASITQGLSWKDSARVATAAVLSPTNTYANGSSGVGATLTATGVGVLTVDGQATVLGDRIIVKDEAAGLENGLYEVTTEGTAGVAYILTRVTDADVSAELDGAAVFAQQGTTNADNAFVQTVDNPTIGTTALAFSQFTSSISLGGTPSTIQPDDAADEGVSSTAARSDHAHAIVAAAAGTSDFGDAAGEGASTSFARADHTHGREEITMEPVTAQNITGTDTAITDTLDNTPARFLGLWLNGQLLPEGAGEAYTRSGATLTWLASSGCAPDLVVADELRALYAY